MTLNLLKDSFSAYGMRVRTGAQVVPTQWDGDWLETEYRVDPFLSIFLHTHADLLPIYFGIDRTGVPVDLPTKPPIQTP